MKTDKDVCITERKYFMYVFTELKGDNKIFSDSEIDRHLLRGKEDKQVRN